MKYPFGIRNYEANSEVYGRVYRLCDLLFFARLLPFCVRFFLLPPCAADIFSALSSTAAMESCSPP